MCPFNIMRVYLLYLFILTTEKCISFTKFGAPHKLERGRCRY